MATLYLKQFGGLQPSTAPRLLPDTGAQVASNVRLVSGEIRPLRKPVLAAVVNNPMPATAIYQARNGENSAWLSWTKDVDAVRGPLADETESRHYWSGDGEPRYGTFSVITQGGGNNYPSAFFALGIPTPLGVPSVAVTGGAGSNITRFYCCTFFSALGEESGPSRVSTEVTGRVDGTWDVTGLSAFPANTGTGTAAHSSGITTFTNGASAPTWLRPGDEVVIAGQTLEVTTTPAAHTFTVAGDFSAATTWARKAPWNTTGMKRRLYRTTGTLGTFQLVHDDVGLSYADTLTDANILGDELITKGWEPPSPKLKGLTVHSSGALVGFEGARLLVSVPNQPHAWVKAFSRVMEFDIVGIAAYGSEVAVTTKGIPYIVSGTEPESMTREKVSGMYPCLSKRSVVSVGDGVIYASQHGVVYLGAKGSDLITRELYTKDEWLLENPEGMVFAFAMGDIFMSSVNASGVQRILSLMSGQLDTADVEAFELYTDPATGLLYLSTPEGISEWDSPLGAPMTSTWRSKTFVSPPPVNMAAAKIQFDPAIAASVQAAVAAEIAKVTAANNILIAAGDLQADINDYAYNVFDYNGSALQPVPVQPPGNTVSFSLYINQELVFSKAVSDTRAFRLPAGYKSDEMDVQVSSESAVFAIRLADSMEALKNV